jgi:hypothetical protein
MLQGTIDTLIIKRDNVEIYLGPGEVTLYDFGAEKHSMIFYSGPGRFVYTPPDKIEEQYLRVVTGLEKIDGEFKDASFIMVNEEVAPIDTSLFKREKIKERHWREVTRFNDELGNYLGINPHIRVYGDILSGEPASCFLVKFKIEDIGDLVYCEDPLCDDYSRIYRYTDKDKPPDIIAGYSSDGLYPRQRGYISVDITHYDINAKIDELGKIEGNCGIRFKPLREDLNFVYFDLSKDLKISSATDSSGESLPFFSWEDSPGFGIWLDQSMQAGGEYLINVEYEGKPFIYEWEIYFSDNREPWYPENLNPDRSTYEMDFNYPENYKLAFNETTADEEEKGKDDEAKWIIDHDIMNVPLYFGPMYTAEFKFRDTLTIKMLAPRLYNWITKSDPMDTRRDVLVNVILNLFADVDWQDKSYEELQKSLYFDLNLMEKCEFDAICAVEFPYENQTGSAGIIPLTSKFGEKFRIRDEFVRAHELAHLWWGQTVGVENESNTWILEGLAEYFAFIVNQDPYGRENLPDSIFSAWRDSILTARNNGFPITMGPRLNNSVFDHYHNLVITKSAYIFHMIRYMLYDFNENSDRLFLKFLRDIVDTYKWQSIDANGLNGILEKHIGMEMDWFFRQWAQGIEIPQYHVSYDFPETVDSTYSVKLRVKQENVPPEFKMIVPVKIDMEDDYYVIHKLMIDEPEKEIRISELPYKPIKLEFNIERAVLCEEVVQEQ